MNDELGKLYSALIGKGYSEDDLGNEETFREKMSDKGNRKELYDWVSSRGDFRIGGYDAYEQRLAPKVEQTQEKAWWQTEVNAPKAESPYPVNSVEFQGQVDQEEKAIAERIAERLPQANAQATRPVADVVNPTSDKSGYTFTAEELERMDKPEKPQGIVWGEESIATVKLPEIKPINVHLTDRQLKELREMPEPERNEAVESGSFLTDEHKKAREEFDKGLTPIQRMQMQDGSLSALNAPDIPKNLKYDYDFKKEFGFFPAGSDTEFWHFLKTKTGEEYQMKMFGRPLSDYEIAKLSEDARRLGFWGTVGQGFKGLGYGLKGVELELAEGIADLFGVEHAKENINEERERILTAQDNFKPTAEGVGGFVAEMIPQMTGTGLGLLVSAVNPVAGAAIVNASTAAQVASSMGSTALEARRAGASDAQTAIAMLLSGGAELLSEKYVNSKYIKRIMPKAADVVAEAGDKALESELNKLLQTARKELGGKFTAKTAKDLVGDMFVEGASEFSAEAVQALIPIIYENKEDYPTIVEVFNAGLEGFKGGIFMGGIFGGTSSLIQNRANNQRRREQGFVDVANVEIGGKPSFVEVLGKDKDGNFVVLNGDETVSIKESQIKERKRFDYNDFRNAEVEYAREIGYEQEPTGENAVKEANEYTNARNEVVKVLSLAEGADVDAMLEGRTAEEIAMGDTEVEDAVNNYIKARARRDGFRERYQEERDRQFAESDRSVDETANDGMVYTTIAPSGEKIIITGGKVVLDNEGYIDVNQSEGLVAMFPDGSRKPVRPGELREKVEVSNAEETKAARRASIEEQWRAEFESAENAYVEQQKRTEGVVFDVTDKEGTHRVEVVKEGDEISNILVDGEAVQISTEMLNALRGEAGVTQTENGNVETENEVQPEVAPGDEVQPAMELTPAQTELPKEKQAVASIPTEKRGKEERAAYHMVPIERTMEDLHDGTLEPDEIVGLIDARIKEAESDVKAVENKKPVIGADKNAYVAAKQQWQADMEAAKAKLDYYNNLKAVNAEVTRSEMREAVGGVQPQVLIEQTADEFVANLLGGWIKITPESFQKETGLKAEQKQMVGVIAGKDKGGVSIERAAEIILENYGDELRGLGFNGDMQDIRDMIINILSNGNPRSYAKKGAEMRAQESVEEQLSQLESIAIGMNFADTQEMIEYEEAVVPRIVQDYTGFDETEYFNNLAENIEYDTTRESEGTRGSSELLQGEQSADNAGTGNIAEPGQGGKVQGDVYSGGENATSQGNQQVSSSEITDNQNRDNVSPVEGVAEGGNAPGQSGVQQNESGKQSLAEKVVATAKKKQQARFADHAKGIAEKLGVEVTVHNDESTVTNKDAMAAISEGGEVKGWYNPNTGEIALFLPAMESMRDVESTILHEAVSHYGIKHFLGKEDFDKFLDGVWDMMPAGARAFYLDYVGADMKNPSQAKMRQAADEYVAHIAEKLDLNELERSVWQRFIDYVMDVLRKAGFKNLKQRDVEAVIRASYANLRKNGNVKTENGKVSQVIGQGNLLIDDFGENLSEEGIRFSIRTDKEVVANREKQLARSIRNGLLSKSEANDIREASKAMLEIAQVIADAKNGDGTAMFPSFSQWNGMEVMMNANGRPVVSVIKANSEYPMNIDFAKDCIKRDATNRVLNRLAQVAPQMFTSLTSEQLAAINDIIKKHGLSVPCVGCFVEAKRYRSPEYARSVVNVWNTLVDAVEKGDEAIAETKKELGDKVSLNKIVEHLKKNPSDRIKLSESDIVSPKNYSALMIEHPAVPQLLQNTQGQNVAQLVVPEAVYYGDVLKLTGENAWDVDAAYQVGGVRIQSFSDFKSKLFFDYCQVLADLASKRLPAHSYTKVPAFAELFGLTGMKINLSLYFEGTGLDSEGNYTYSSESISPEFAYDLQSREGYTENVGTMAIGVSDEHIWKMMKDENIRSISPYHKSGINPVVANRLKASQFTDYTNEQNAVIPKTERLENESWQDYYGRITERVDGKVPSVGKKVVPDFNLYDDLLETNDPVQTAKNYVEHCQANGIVPKFASFVYNPDGSFNNEYYKLLYDFAVTDMNGEYAPQGAVTWNGASMPANTAEILQSSLSTEEATIAKNQAQTDAVVDDILRELGEEKEDIRFRRANKNQEVFVSNAQRAVEGIKQEKATPEQWIAMLKKNGGLKAGEEAWLGLEEWLTEKGKVKGENGKVEPVTKQEILDFIGENKIQIEEVNYTQFGYGLIDEATRKLEAELKEIGWDAMVEKYPGFDELFEVYDDELLWSEEWASVGEYEDFIIDNKIVDLDSQSNAINETREKYTTEGLERKREIALTVPTIEPYNENDEVHFGDAGNGRAVAWVRFGETTDSEGNRVLVIDEIQSKRHQDGREKGYKNPNAEAELEKVEDAYREAIKAERDYDAELKGKYNFESVEGSLLERAMQFKNSLTEDEKAKREELKAKKNELAADYYALLNGTKGVPAAPFEKNWHELAMKRMLRLAAEEGFDKVAWTTGEQQAERYNIGSVVEYIDVSPYKAPGSQTAEWTDVRINAGVSSMDLRVDVDGNIVSGGNRTTNMAGEKLADVVGKELADKILSTKEDTILDGESLRIGGEGMKGFYDRMLPSFVSKYTKKWGAKVGEVTMPNLGENNTMHSVDVTPEMKESVMEGQTMFSKRMPDKDAPIKEHTRTWAERCQEENPKLWNEVVDALKVLPEWGDAVDADARAMELLESLCERENYSRVEKEMKTGIKRANGVFEMAERISSWAKVKAALKSFWNWVQRNVFHTEPMDWQDFVDDVVGRYYGMTKAQRLQERIGSLARDVLNAVFKQSGIDIDLAEPVEVEQVAVVETESEELNQRPEGTKNGELETENAKRQTENGSIGTEENGSQAASEPQARNRNMDRETWKKAFKKGGEKAYDLMYELHGGIVSRFPQEFLAYLKGVVGVPSDVANVVEVAHNYLVHDFKNKNPELFKVEDAPAVSDVHSLLATKGYSLLEHTMDNGKAIGVKMMYRDKFVPSGQTDTSYTPEGHHGRTVICYYSDPDSRLHQQYVFTVTKNNATETPTAYELAADPSLMTPEWAEYLEKTGRKNEDGSYNLEGLQPDFSDPFSLSHLMIRIGKTSVDVEIISRYNHGAFDANGVYQQIAGQPNATLDGNLNKLASGLYGALADYKGIKPQDVMLAEGVKIADDGKVYRFTRMAGDIYVGDGFWIKDNEAHVVDRNKERMVGDVIVGKDYVYDIRKNIKIPVRKAAVIDGGIEFYTGGEAVTEIREIEVNGEKRKVEKTTWKGGEKTTLKDNVLTTEITDGELLTNVARMARPEEIVATDIKEVGDGFLSRLAPLERVEMPNLERVGDDAFSRTRVALYSFPKLREVGDGFLPGCTSYFGMKFPSLEKVGDEFMSSAGTFGIADGVVILPKLREVGDGFLQSLSVQSVVFKSLEVAGDGFLQNAVVKTIGTPELRQVGENFMSENAGRVEVMSAPKLENVPADFMAGNAAVKESIEEQRQEYLEEQQESEQTMFRKMNEHAEEFNKTHKGGVPVVDIDPNNMEAELAEEGFDAEEIDELKKRMKKGVAAVYNTDKKIIYLLVPSQDKESVYSTCWHEDTHAAIDFLGLTPEMMDEFYSFAQGKKKEAFEALLDKFGYDKEAYPEESLAYGVQAMQILDNWGAETLSKLFGSTAEGAQRQMEIIQPLIDYINNGRQGTQSSVGETVRDRGMYNNTANQKKTAETEGTGATATGGLTEAVTEQEGETLFRRAEQMGEDEVVLTGNAVAALGERLNTGVNIVKDIDSLPENLKAKKGWYDAKTGEVVVVMDNHVSMEDAMQTVLHEIVGRKGLRAVMGEKFNDFLDFAFRTLPKNVQSRINNAVMTRFITRRQAVEEYLAELAGKGNVMDGVKQWMRDYFRNEMNLEVEDGELQYMLWKNNQRKQTPNVISMVQDRVMEAETNTGDNGTRFRIANDTAKDAYEKNVRGWWNKLKEGHYDRLRSVRKAQEAIADETGMPISDSEDVYSYAEHLPSINKIMKEQFDNKFLTPFIKLLKRIYDVEFNGKKLDEKSVERYTNAKHGLERNRDMAVANALTTVEEVNGKKKPVFNKDAYEDWQTKKAAILAENITWEEKQDKLDALAKTYGAKLKDYSGLTAIFDPEGKMKYKQLRDEAIKYVTEMEGAIGKKSIDKLWKIVKGMTDFSLKQSYESGLLSKDMYESISKRYEFYVPLRGFTEETAEDYYDYLAADHTPLNSVIKRAEGRESEADNIFATILNMANSAIVFGNKNRLKQRVLNLATRHKSSLLSVDRAWYEKKGEDVWELALPVTNENMTEEQLAQAYADFDADMKRKEALGEARRQVEGLNIKTRVISDQNKAQHAIRVKRNGREYIVWVNASPTMANAVNGMLREEETGWALSAIDAINKFRSKMVTQFSPTFVFTNLFRDVQSASTVYGVRYGAKALGQFVKNVMGNSVKMMGLYVKFKKGTLDESVPLERYFKEFLENGGETGYTEMISIEEYNKALNKLTEKLNIKNATGRALEAAGEGIEFANRCVENLCRFSAYMTSRENGISILQSVNDAKEVSVNFNRKGSGAKGAGMAKRLFMFYNPAVQALVQRYLLAKNYPKRMIPVLAGEFALGAMQPILFATISALASSAFGDDDDETWEEKFNRAMGRYYNLTDYRRRGSVCLPLGDGVFNPPLAHESRVFFGLGELAMSWYNGHETYDNIPAQAMDIIGQSLPLNPVEGWAQTGNLTESLLLNLTPDALKPFAENAVNRDFAGNKIHNASDMNAHLPEYMRGKKSTAEIYNRISKLLSGGESDFERGFLDKNASQLVNPSKLEHLVEGYLGGAYTFAEKLVRSASWAMGNEENADARNIPFVSSFYTPIGKYEEIPSAERTRRDWERAFDYYQGEMKLLDGKEKAAKRGLKFGMENAAETLEAMQGGEALMVDVFNDGNKILKELYADVDAARTAKDFDKVKEIDQEIYAQKRFITERMEQMVENPAMGYTFKTNKSEGAYGERETYGDVRDMNVINEFQKVLNPLIEEHKKQLEGKSEDEQYALYKKNEAMIEMYKTLKKKEQIVSNYKKAMESNPEKADEYMNNIRELRSEAVELINNYNE